MRHFIAGSLMIALSNVSVAQGINPLSPSLYYEIGGGTAFNRPLAENTELSSHGVEATLQLPLNCGIWDERHLDPDAWLNSIQDYAEGQLNALGQAVVVQLQSFAQGLAVAALQRALPGMYAYSQSLTASIEGKIDVAKRSCEAVVADINNGVNPVDPWRRIGTAVSWRSTLTDNGFATNAAGQNVALPSTIIEAEAQVAASGNEPIPWFGGLRGLVGEPIIVTEDLVRAGFNIHSGTVAGANVDLDDSNSSSPTGYPGVAIRQGLANNDPVNSRLSEMFPAGQAEAIAWAQRFLGEQTIHTCDEAADPACASTFEPGLGLASMVSLEVEVLRDDWLALLDPNNPTLYPNTAEMRLLSSPSVMISPKVFEALSRFPEQDQDLYIGRLIDDVALSRTVERALAIRKMLKSSAETPMVQGYKQASEVADELIAKITLEVDDLLWTMEAQKKLTSNTSSALLEYDAIRNSRGAGFIATGRRLNVVNALTDRPVPNTEIQQQP